MPRRPRRAHNEAATPERFESPGERLHTHAPVDTPNDPLADDRSPTPKTHAQESAPRERASDPYAYATPSYAHYSAAPVGSSRDSEAGVGRQHAPSTPADPVTAQGDGEAEVLRSRTRRDERRRRSVTHEEIGAAAAQVSAIAAGIVGGAAQTLPPGTPPTYIAPAAIDAGAAVANSATEASADSEARVSGSREADITPTRVPDERSGEGVMVVLQAGADKHAGPHEAPQRPAVSATTVGEADATVAPTAQTSMAVETPDSAVVAARVAAEEEDNRYDHQGESYLLRSRAARSRRRRSSVAREQAAAAAAAAAKAATGSGDDTATSMDDG